VDQLDGFCANVQYADNDRLVPKKSRTARIKLPKNDNISFECGDEILLKHLAFGKLAIIRNIAQERKLFKSGGR